VVSRVGGFRAPRLLLSGPLWCCDAGWAVGISERPAPARRVNPCSCTGRFVSAEFRREVSFRVAWLCGLPCALIADAATEVDRRHLSRRRSTSFSALSRTRRTADRCGLRRKPAASHSVCAAPDSPQTRRGLWSCCDERPKRW